MKLKNWKNKVVVVIWYNNPINTNKILHIFIRSFFDNIFKSKITISEADK